MHFAEEPGKGMGFFFQVQDRFFAGEINPYGTDRRLAASGAQSVAAYSQAFDQAVDALSSESAPA